MTPRAQKILEDYQLYQAALHAANNQAQQGSAYPASVIDFFQKTGGRFTTKPGGARDFHGLLNVLSEQPGQPANFNRPGGRTAAAPFAPPPLNPFAKAATPPQHTANPNSNLFAQPDMATHALPSGPSASAENQAPAGQPNYDRAVMSLGASPAIALRVADTYREVQPKPTQSTDPTPDQMRQIRKHHELDGLDDFTKNLVLQKGFTVEQARALEAAIDAHEDHTPKQHRHPKHEWLSALGKTKGHHHSPEKMVEAAAKDIKDGKQTAAVGMRPTAHPAGPTHIG